MFSLYLYISNIDRFCFLNSWIGKNYYPQVFSEEYKYVVKEKMSEYITDDKLLKKILIRKILMKKISNEEKSDEEN